MDQRVEYLIRAGFTALEKGDAAGALGHYSRLIMQLPNQPIGYIGKMVSLLKREGACSFGELEAPILQCKGLTCAPEYERDLEKLVNFDKLELGATPLTFVCNGLLADAAEILVDLGANIHHVCEAGVTPLWFVCRKELPEDKKEEGRRIAKLLLDLGAEVNVVNKCGVMLFNERTDPEIRKMIRQRQPGAAQGVVGGETQKEGTSMATVLALVGAAIGLILGTVLDKFFAGFLWAGALAAILWLLGSQIDRIRRKEEVGKAVRNLLIAVALIGAFLMILLGGIGGGKSYGHCPNCGTKMETKYINYAANRCTRCDGNSWN